MTTGFYKGKKVFITGHTGFKGSWLTLWLDKLGAVVTGFALDPPTNPAMYDICRVNCRINSITGDVRDGKALGGALEEARPEIVFHLAAQPIVRTSYEMPVETYEVNVMGTVNLLEAIRRCPAVKAVVVVTSDKCYENRESFWGYRETDSLGGYDPYSSSKACQELAAAAYRNSFFNPAEHDKHGVAIATARAGNVIGGGDFARDRLVPDIIRSIMRNERFVMRNPGAIRPWQHVLEPLYGYLTLAEKLYVDGAAYSGAWNFGPDCENIKPVEWIANKLLSFFGMSGYCLGRKDNYHETRCLKLDSFKARQLLNFKPRLGIEKTLEMTALWVKAYLNKEDMLEFTLRQIDEYK